MIEIDTFLRIVNTIGAFGWAFGMSMAIWFHLKGYPFRYAVAYLLFGVSMLFLGSPRGATLFGIPDAFGRVGVITGLVLLLVLAIWNAHCMRKGHDLVTELMDEQ